MDEHSPTSDPIADLRNDCNESEIKKCFCLLEQGNKRIPPDEKEVVLVLGITGSGKTTLVQFLAGDDGNLYAVDAGTNIGEYTIVDKGKKISGDETIVSKTIIPDRITDPRTNTTFYDCPGFSDTRGTAIDVAGTYFVHKIIRSAERVKILITVNYSSLRTGLDRGNFLQLMEHTLKMIKNVDKYKNSMALMVTKVENQIKNRKFVNDLYLLDYMVKFLEKFKTDVATIREPEFVRNVVTLIDTLIEKDKSGYRKIGIFRRPIEEGSLATQKFLQDGKKRMLQIIAENLQFADVDINDFGYTISDQSKNDIQGIVDNINRFIVQRVELISKEAMANYEANEIGIVEIEELTKMFETGLRETRIFIDQLDENVNVPEFVSKLIAFFEQKNVSKKHWLSILDQQSYLEFLELVGEKKLTASSLNWKPGFSPILKYLDTSTKWYTFLTTLQKILFSYDLQKNVDDYRYLLNPKIFDINDERLKRFASTRPQLKFNDVQSLQIEAKKLDILNKVLDSTLSSSMSVHYDNRSDTYRVSGNYVLLSEAIKGYPKNAKFLNIFATDTIFIDCNLTRGTTGLHQLSIIAPTWEIMGKKEIVLNGQNGSASIRKAADGLYSGASGNTGSPGLPGESGGNFFGIGANFINSHYLSILADGGKGGRGQEGGDGVAGSTGRDTLIQRPDGCEMSNVFQYAKIRYLDGVIFRDYCILGQLGGNGGHGGNGGAGGEGGNAGNVKFITLNEPQDVVVSHKKGDRGSSGNGGRGGAGGKAAKSWVHETILFWWQRVDCDDVRKRLDEYPSCPEEDQQRDGIRGNDGKNGENRWGIKQPRDTDTQNPSTIINEYKELFRDALARKTVSRKRGMEFLKGLNENTSTIQFYDPIELVQEFMDLENDYSKNQSHMDFPPQYEQLLNRVEKQLKTVTDHTQLYVLKKLRTSILSKIFLLGDEPEAKLIVNMQEYLDRVNNELEKFNWALAVRQQSQSRINGTKNEIKDIRMFLQGNILGQTEQISKELKDKIIASATELYTLEQKAAEKEKSGVVTHVKDWAEQKISDVASKIPLVGLLVKPKIETTGKWTELKNRLSLLQVIEALKDIGQFLNFANDFAHEVSEKPVSVHTLPVFTNLTQLLDRNLPYINGAKVEAEVLASKLDKLDVVKSTDSLRQREDKLKELRKKLQNASTDQLYRTKNELIITLKDIDKELRKQLYSDKMLENLKSINDILITIRLFDAGFEKTRPTDQGTTMLLDFALQDPRVSQIQFYIHEILNVVANTIASITDGNSKPTILDVQSRIKSAVNNFKPLIKKLNEGTELPEEISTCYDMVEEATKLVLATFERLQHCEQLNRLVSSIDEESPDPTFSNNKNLKMKVDTLNTITESNLLLNQYKNTRKIVDRFVFPFGKVHESEFGLHDDQFKDIKKGVMQKIQAMSSAVEKYRTSLTAPYDGYRNESDFNDDTSTAFYAWYNNEYRNTIADLLSGKRVVLKADIAKGVAKNAVKFDKIQLNLKSSDEKLNTQLKEDLSNIEVSLTLFENSYYRCKNEVYVFELEKQNIVYSFATDETGQPKSMNSIYKRIRNGDFILSPYATWAIQLLGSESDFNTLRKYQNNVDLLLEGHGQYIEDSQVCDGTLKNYYKLDSVIPENAVPKKPAPKGDVSKPNATESNSNTTDSSIQGTTHSDEIIDMAAETPTNESAPASVISNDLYNATIVDPGNKTVTENSSRSRSKRNIRMDNTNQNQRKSTDGIRNNESAINGTVNGYLKSSFESDYLDGTAGYIPKNDDDNATNDLSVSPQYNVNDGLVLIDLIIRTFTKSKPNYFKECATNYVNARICALGIIDEWEEILRSVSMDPEELDFDPVSLIRELEKEIINGNHKNMGKILSRTVENGSTLGREEFNRRIQKEVNRRMKNLLPRVG